MLMKTSELTGQALVWAIAKAEGREDVRVDTDGDLIGNDYFDYLEWDQGGPIIERERISIRQWTNVPIVNAYMPAEDAAWSSDAKSPLVAAMRCYVASKLGDKIEVPDELVKDIV